MSNNVVEAKLNKQGEVVGTDEDAVIKLAQRELKEDFIVFKKGKKFIAQQNMLYAYVPIGSRIFMKKKKKGWKELDKLNATYIYYEGTKWMELSRIIDSVTAKNRKKGSQLAQAWETNKYYKKYRNAIEKLREEK